MHATLPVNASPDSCASPLGQSASTYCMWNKELSELLHVLIHVAGYDALVHKRYALSGWKSTKACMRREVILVKRHSFVYLFRIAQVCLLMSPNI